MKMAKRIALLSVIGIVLGLTVYKINAKFLLGDPLPMPLGIGASVVISGSMEPELSVYDLLVIKKTEAFALEQIVVFQDGDSLIVHRIKAIDEDSVTTKGDANSAYDEPIPREAIKGEVILAIPLLGALVLLIQNPVIIILLLIIALLLLERSYKREKEQKETELEEIKREIEKLNGDLDN